MHVVNVKGKIAVLSVMSVVLMFASLVLPAFADGIYIVHVSPTAGPVGTTVYVSGGGATAKGLVTLYFDHRNVANTTAEDWGSWGASFQVPDVAPGNYTITALDVTSNTTDTAMFTVTPPPTVYVTPQEAPIGSKITINGEGFSPRTGIFLMFEDMLFFTPIYVDEKGGFNATIFVPVVNSGNYTIKAVGAYLYPEVRVLAHVSFTVTVGLDTLFETMADIKNTLNQTDSTVNALNQAMNDIKNALNQTHGTVLTVRNETSLTNVAANEAKDEALAAKENAKSAEIIATEARTYALTAMIFAIITAALSAAVLIKRK